MKELVLRFAPVWLQNIAISLFNTMQYRLRRGGVYSERRKYFERVDGLTFEQLINEQSDRLNEFIDWVNSRSKWYGRYNATFLRDFPPLEKSDLIKHFTSIATISEVDAVVSLTGGTTGASMKVYYTKEDTQERHALLDHFRASHGYTLGKKVAWFSGKNLTREKDLSRGVCYRDDWINNIRFFSTFNISDKHFDAYWAGLEKFGPEFIVGFPSSVYDICVMARQRGLKFKGTVKVFFPTAETVLAIHREVIGEVLGCRLVDQYASSEGAPFILECASGSKHIHPLSGVFEVVDENMKPAQEGEMLVTSFTTHGTPLVRYRIGDRIRLADSSVLCECGSKFPVVDYIDGRSSDYIFSSENGKVNLGNISNCTKDVVGIVCFQIEQNKTDEILVKVVPGEGFDHAQEMRFVAALSERVGSHMSISIRCVSEIPREASGKFRLVKNYL